MFMSGEEATNPDVYEQSYSALRSFIENSIDKYRTEMVVVLYPLFLHIYLILVERNQYEQARHFMDNFKADHMDQHGSELQRLAAVVSPLHLKENDFIQNLKMNKYRLSMSTYTFELLLSFLQEQKHIALLKILNQNLVIKVAAFKQDEPMGVFAESEDAGQIKENLRLGPLPQDPWLVAEMDRIINEKESAELYKVLEQMRSEVANSPSRDNVPLIPSKNRDVHQEIERLHDIRKRITLGPGSLPSICSYTFHNSYGGLNKTIISDDAALLVAGFADSTIKVWHNHMSATSAKAATSIPLVGHSGPVYGLSMDPRSEFLFSCSEDGTARLWSLQTFSNLVVYKGHQYPIWDIDVSPSSLYFATASYDKTARLWSCDHIYPLRLYVGHSADVNCVKFHPNSNYVITGSEDHTVRLWDVQRGSCVRLLNQHRGPVMSVAISPNGKYAASAGEDKQVILWDLAEGKAIQTAKAHSASITSLAFSEESSVLASASLDGTIRLWDVQAHASDKAFLMSTMYTKSTSVYNLKFSKRNLLYSLGCFPQFE